MQAVIKIQGKRDIQNAGFGLMSNDGTSQSCRTSVVYSAYDDVMVITIRPVESNNIGGPGNTWQIYGDLVVDGVAMDLYIKAPEPVEPSIEPTLPIIINASNQPEVIMAGVAKSLADVQSCQARIVRYPAQPVFVELVGKQTGDEILNGDFRIGKALTFTDGLLSYQIILGNSEEGRIINVQITSSLGEFTFE